MSFTSPSTEAYAVPAAGFPSGFYSQHPAMGQPLEGPIYLPPISMAQILPQPTVGGESTIYPYYPHFPPIFITSPHHMYMASSPVSDSEPGTSSKAPQAEEEEEEEEEE
jgi:hypothetical protein